MTANEACPRSSLPPHLQLSPLISPLSSESLKEIPFIEILHSPLAHASRKLRARLNATGLNRLSDSGFEDLVGSLAKELSDITKHVLLHEFNLFRTQGAAKVQAAYARLSQSSETKVYHDFVRAVTADGGAAFYRRYPELRPLLTLRIAYWLRSSHRLIQSFHADSAGLDTVLGIPATARISRIFGGLSDSHHKGQSVSIITLSTGKRIVYKPRKVDLEEAFMRVLGFLNSRADEPLFRVMRLLPCSHHGWCEYISHTQTEDPEGLKVYFRRVGHLLAALHAFRATDCHFENLIACDGFPVMVDLETVGHANHEWNTPDREGVTELVELYSSVSRVGLLPIIRTTGDELDLSALGAALDPQNIPAERFEALGTALMGLKQFDRTLDAHEVLPTRVQADREALVEQMAEGFMHAYGLISEVKGELLKRSELIPSFQHTYCRYVARPTRQYSWLSQRCLDYTTLHDRDTRRNELSRVYRAAEHSAASPHWSSIAAVEYSCLERNDIPHFHTPMDSLDLWSGRQLVAKNAFAASPLELIKNRISSLSDADCALQCRIIRLSFAQRFHTDHDDGPRELPSSPNPLSSSRLVQSAEDIAQNILAIRQTSPSGSPVWLGLGSTPHYGVYRLQPCGSGLYQGSAGVAVFFSALYSVTQDIRYREFSLEALDFYRSSTQSHSNQTSLTLSLGEGLAGQAYAQILAARFTNDMDLFDRAEASLASISPMSIDAMTSVDVIAGIAGLCLVLDAALSVRSNPVIEKLLHYAASKLVQQQETTGPGSAGWRTLDNESIAGFAHGSAGISLALSRAGARLNEQTFLAATTSGFRECDRLYDSNVRNWIDMRQQSRGTQLPCSWCHGATGIGLASISARDSHSLNHDLIRARVRRVVDEWASRPIALDSLCCGAAGTTEWLLQDHDHPDRARRLASCVDYLTNVPFYRNLPNNSSKILLPGLFLGNAGVGYQLLRVAHPDRIPSLLTFQ